MRLICKKVRSQFEGVECNGSTKRGSKFLMQRRDTSKDTQEMMCH